MSRRNCHHAGWDHFDAAALLEQLSYLSSCRLGAAARHRLTLARCSQLTSPKCMCFCWVWGLTNMQGYFFSLQKHKMRGGGAGSSSCLGVPTPLCRSICLDMGLLFL